MRLLGYTRVSIAGQDAQLQLDALVGIEVQKRDEFSDVASVSKTAKQRPGMRRLFDYAEEGAIARQPAAVERPTNPAI